MPTSYREGVILAPKSVLEPGEIERLNAILHDAGLGRPLQPSPMDRTYETVVLALAGADPLAVRDALRRESPKHADKPLPDLSPIFEYDVGTHGYATYEASGKKIGHGGAWLSAPDYEMPPRPPWRPLRRRPVVAPLDTKLKPHDWLPEPVAGQSFAEEVTDWPVQVPISRPEPVKGERDHRGHGTFIAGLLRLAAPAAQVLSIPVMDTEGKVYGVWVQEWREGDGVVSLMPVLRQGDLYSGYAWSRGTSFAAARYAGELAARIPVEKAIPAPVARP